MCFLKEAAVVVTTFMLVFATITLASFCSHGFSTSTTVIYLYCLLSTCIGIYVAWDMNLTWHKFYTYLISEKAIFSILFNYAVIQLFLL